MSDTALSVNFIVQDVLSDYDIVGTSDNYSFKRTVPGLKLADQDGDTASVNFDLEGNYGEFTVRVYAKSNLGIRSEFIEKRINIPAPEFKGTFTFGELRFDKIPAKAAQNNLVLESPSQENNLYVVDGEFVNGNPKIVWGLIPPIGHPLEGKLVKEEVLLDPFFKKFEVTFYEGDQSLTDIMEGTANPITTAQLNNVSQLQNQLAVDDVGAALRNYKDFEFDISSEAYKKLFLDEDVDSRKFSAKIVGFDQFDVPFSGVLGGENKAPQMDFFLWNLEKGVFECNGLSSDADWMGMNLYRFSSDGEEFPNNANIDDYKAAQSQAGLALTKEKYYYSKEQLESEDEKPKLNQTFNKNYFYAVAAVDGLGEGPLQNLTADGLKSGGKLIPVKYNLKIGYDLFRESSDDLIFEWKLIDNFGDVVDIEDYSRNDDDLSLSPEQMPLASYNGILGFSGALLDAKDGETIMGYIGASEGNANNKTNYTLNTNYRYARDFNNAIYGDFSIRESGKRDIDLHLSLVDSDKEVIDEVTIYGRNPAPKINFLNVDSLRSVGHIDFDFVYAGGSREKTTKVDLFRNEASKVDDRNFDIDAYTEVVVFSPSQVGVANGINGAYEYGKDAALEGKFSSKGYLQKDGNHQIVLYQGSSLKYNGQWVIYDKTNSGTILYYTRYLHSSTWYDDSTDSPITIEVSNKTLLLPEGIKEGVYVDPAHNGLGNERALDKFIVRFAPDSQNEASSVLNQLEVGGTVTIEDSRPVLGSTGEYLVAAIGGQGGPYTFTISEGLESLTSGSLYVNSSKKYFVQTFFGEGKQSFGNNITSIEDDPPFAYDVVDGSEEITPYYYKVLPYDSYGSGYLHHIQEKAYVYPYSYYDGSQKYPGSVDTGPPLPITGFQEGTDTSFETYFLNWDASLSTDVSHYEIWVSDQPSLVDAQQGADSFKRINEINAWESDVLYNEGDWISGKKDENAANPTVYQCLAPHTSDHKADYEDTILPTQNNFWTDHGANPVWSNETLTVHGQSYKSLYSRHEGFSVVEPVSDADSEGYTYLTVLPTDPAEKLLTRKNPNANGEIAVTVPANQNSLRIKGKTNEVKYFWVRTVDKAKNKSLFFPDPSNGFRMALGQAKITDLEDFEQGITEQFENTIALIPNNPFLVDDVDGKISWGSHYLYNKGIGYFIEGSGININPQDDGAVPASAPIVSDNSIEHNLAHYINDTHPLVVDDNNFTPSDYTRTDLKEKLKDEFQAADKFFIYWTPRDTKSLTLEEETAHGTKKDEGENTSESLTVEIVDSASGDTIKLSIEGVDTSPVLAPESDSDAASKLAAIINAVPTLDASISASVDNNAITISGGEGVTLPPVSDSSVDLADNDLSVTVSAKTFHTPDGIATDTNDITNPLKTVEKRATYRFAHANPSNLAIIADTKAGDGTNDRIEYNYERFKLNQSSDNSLMQEGDFVVAQFIRGVGIKQAFHAFANAVIGSASIADAAIISAKIKDLIADKVRAGTIGAEDIRVYGGTRASASESVEFAEPAKALDDYVAGAGAWGTIGSSIDGTVGWDDFPFSQVNDAGDRAIEYKRDQVVSFSNPNRGYFKAKKNIGATVKTQIQIVNGETPADVMFLRPGVDDLLEFDGRNKFDLEEGSLVVPSENIIVEKVLNAGNVTLPSQGGLGLTWVANINGTNAPSELQGSVTITFSGTATETETLAITVQQLAKEPSHTPGGAGEIHWTRLDDSTAGESLPGFYIRGDGSFAFQAPNGVLKFEDGELVIEGSIRQTSGATFGLVALTISSNIVTYDEWNQLSTRTPKIIDANANFQNPAGEVVHHGIKWKFDVSDPEGSQGGNRLREVYRLAFEDQDEGGVDVRRARIKVALYTEDNNSSSNTFGGMIFDKEENYDPTAAGYIGSGNSNFTGVSSKHFLKLDGGTSSENVNFEGTGNTYQYGVLADFYAMEDGDIVEPYSGGGLDPVTPNGMYVVTEVYEQGDVIIAPTTYGANGVFIYINTTPSLGKPVTNANHWRQLFHRNFGINDKTKCTAQLYTTALEYRSNATLTIEALDIGDSTAAIYKDAESFGQSVFFINPLDGTAIKNKNKDQKLELQTVWQYENNLPMDLYYDADLTSQVASDGNSYHGSGWSLRNYEQDKIDADLVSLFYRFGADPNGTLSGDVKFYYISLRDLMFTDGDILPFNVSTTSGSKLLTLPAGETTTNLAVGQNVYGVSMPSVSAGGARIKSIVSSTTFEVTASAVATHAATTIAVRGDLPTVLRNNTYPNIPTILGNYKELGEDFPVGHAGRDNVVSRLEAIRTDIFPGRYGPPASPTDGRALGVEEVTPAGANNQVWQNNNKYNVRIGRDAIEDQLLIVAASEEIDLTDVGGDYVDPVTKLPIFLGPNNYARTPINQSGDLEALDSITLSDVLDGGAAGFLEVDKPLSIIRGRGKGALDVTNKRTLTAQFSRDGHTTVTDYASASVWVEAMEGDDQINLYVELADQVGKTSHEDNQSGQGTITDKPSLHIHTVKITASDSKGNEYTTRRGLRYKVNRGTPEAPATLLNDTSIEGPWQAGYTYYPASSEGGLTTWNDGSINFTDNTTKEWNKVFHLTNGSAIAGNMESMSTVADNGAPNSVSIEFQFTDPNTKRTIFAQETIYLAEGGDSERGIVLGASTQTVVSKMDNTIVPSGGLPTWNGNTVTYPDEEPIKVFARITNLLPSEQSGYSLGGDSGKYKASIQWIPSAGLQLYHDDVYSGGAVNEAHEMDTTAKRIREVDGNSQIEAVYVKPSQIKSLGQASITVRSTLAPNLSVAGYNGIDDAVFEKNPFGTFTDEITLITLEEGTNNLVCLLDNEAASFEAKLVWDSTAGANPGEEGMSEETFVVDDASLSAAATDVFMWEGSSQMTPRHLNDSSASISFEHSPQGTHPDEILDGDLVDIIYNAIWNDDPDPGGRTYWAASGVQVRVLLAGLIGSAPNLAGQGNDPALVNGVYADGTPVAYSAIDVTHGDIPVSTFYIASVVGTAILPPSSYVANVGAKKWTSGSPTKFSSAKEDAAATVQYTINYKNIKGDTGSLTKTQTLSRANSGLVPYGLRLEATSLTIAEKNDLTITPEEIVITAHCQGFEGDITQGADLSGGPTFTNDQPKHGKIIWDLYKWDDTPLIPANANDIANNPYIDVTAKDNQIKISSTGKKGLLKLFFDNARPLSEDLGSGALNSKTGHDYAGIKLKAWTIAPDGRELEDEIIIQKLKAGANAKTVRLETSSYVIKRLKDADLTPTSIVFTAHTPNVPLVPHNVIPSRIDGNNPETVTATSTHAPAHLHKSNISWHLTKKDGSALTGTPTNAIAVDTTNGFGTLTLSDINGASNRAILADGFKVKAVVKDAHFEAGENPEQYPTDSTTIQVLDEGLDAISVINSNENHTLTASEIGEVSSYDGSGTNIQVYEGAAALTYVSSVDATDKSKWTVAASSSHIIPATPSGQNGNTATYGVASALDNAQEAATITYAITGRKANGDEFTTSTVQTFSKSRGAVSPITVVLSNSAHTLSADKDGAVTFYDGSGTTITVYQGADKLTYDATPTAAGQWKAVVTTDAHITAGSISYASNVGTVEVASDVTANQDAPYIDFTITGKTLQGTSINQVVRQQFSKSKQSNIAGPAIVFRGDWDNKLEYFYIPNNDQITRRDVVKYSNAYYINKIAIPANNSGNDDPVTDTSRWEGMGASFNSISTGLEMVDASFVKNTLTMQDGAHLIVKHDSDSVADDGAEIYSEFGTKEMTGQQAGPNGDKRAIGWYLDGDGNVAIGRTESSQSNLTYVMTGPGTNGAAGTLSVTADNLSVTTGGNFLGAALENGGTTQITRAHIGAFNINDLTDVSTSEGLTLAHGKGIVYNAEATPPRWEVGDAGGKVKVQAAPPADPEEGHLWWDPDYAALYVALDKSGQIHWVRAIPEF